MKPEPLKNKTIEIIFKGKNENEAIKITVIDAVNVKSAVHGLLNEIKERKKKLKEDLDYERKKLKEAEDEMEKDVAMTCIDYLKVRLNELSEIEKIIKKWFVDVVMEDES